MSTTIDNRVLEMRFDNKQFESGVATSMSTLDKLKQKLNLSGASKGLENVGKAAKGVNFSGMTAGISQVKAGMVSLEGISAGVIAKFSVINNMVNSLMTTGKRMVNALTIDPVKTGFQEYETQIGAIQTILSNTRQEGTNVEIVNKALDELNTYADKTIYNFTEMTRNIGTFTAAGVKLDTSVNAIKGIANLAAVSGSTSQQASTAMYQLSQALAAGKVSLMDWNSVVNAGMGGKVFQDALIRTSELLGTGAKAAIEANGSFRESLTQSGWLTTEVLTETLNQLAGTYSKADLMAKGFSESQATEIAALAKDAEDAATKVKTFTQLWDVMKEAAQSGWAQTWRLIVGDFEEAKNLLTPLSEFFTGIIGKFSDARNKLLESALATNIRDMFEGIDKSLNTLLEPLDKAKEAITDIGKVVDDVILGKFGNGQERFDSLTKSGYNWMEVQNKVNESLKDGFRYTEEQIAEQDKLIKSQKKSAETTEEGTEATGEATEEVRKLTKAEKDRIKILGSMSEESMRSLGYSEAQINAIKTLKDLSDKLGLSFSELIDNMDDLNGRWLLINSFKNIGEALGKVFSSLGSAWRDVFDPIKPEQIFDAVVAMHRFTEELIMSDGNADKLRSTFKGLFAAIDLITSIVGGGAKFAFDVLSSVLGAFDMNILDLTGGIGEAIFSFNEWIREQNAVSKALDKFVSKIPGYVGKLKSWFDAFKETPAVDRFLDAINNIKKAFSDFSLDEIDLSELANTLGTNLANALLSLPEIAMQIGRDVMAGFQNGIEDGISNSIIGRIISFCAEFISAFAAALGVHSPSTITFAIAGFVIAGFVLGLVNKFPIILDVIKYIGEQIVNAFKQIWDLVIDENGNIEWDKVFSGGLIISSLFMLKKLVDAVDGISDAIGGIGDILEGAGDVLKSFSKTLNSLSWDLKAKAIQKMAISIAILAGAVYALSTIKDPGQLWNAVGVIGALAAIVLALAGAMELMSKASVTYEKGKLNIEGLKASILQIGATLLMLGLVVKIIGEMKPDEAKAGFIALTGLTVEVIAFMAVVGQVVKGGAAENIDKVGKLMTKLAIAMILMTVVVKLASGLSADEMLQGAAFAAAFALFVIAITKVAKSAGNNVGKVGGMVLKITFAMGLMVGVVKLIDTLEPSEMLKGAAFATAFGVFVRALVKATTIGKKQQIAKIGGLILSMTVSLGLMVGVVKLVGKLSAGEMLKGVAFVGAFILFVKALVKIVNVGNEGQMIKVGGTLLALSVAIGILAGVSALLGSLDISGLAKGITAVGLLSVFMAGMVKALKGAQNVKSSVMMLAVSIGIMAVAVTALSMIDTGDLAAATIALSTLMGMFALMEKSLSGMNGVKMGPLIMMTIVVGALGGILAILASLNPGPSIEIAASIGVLMLTLSKSLEMIDNVGRISKNTLKSMAVLGAIAGGMGLILTGLSKLNPGPTLEIATSISEVLIAMSASALILSKIGIFGGIAAKGAAAMLAVVAGAGTILAGLAGLVGSIPGAKEFLEKGIPILETVGKALGSLLGGFIGGIGEGITGSLTPMAEDITSMMEELSKASDKASWVKGESFDGVKKLLETLGSIGLTTVGTSISDIFTLGGTSMDKFQTDGVAFFEAMKAVGEAANGIKIDEESFNAVIMSAEKLAELQTSLPKMDGILSWFTGDKDLATFGAKVSEFMSSMKTAFGTTNGITVNEESFNAVVSASKQLAKLQSSLEEIGGVISWFKGRDDLGTFGRNVGAFMTSMKDAFGVSNEITVNEESFNAVVSASKQLAKLQSSLEEIGGVISWFKGRDDLGTFGKSVGNFMSSMKTAFADLGETKIDNDSITSIINAATKLSELQSSLENIGGVIDWFTGRDDLGTFGEKIGQFATAMGTLKTKMGEDGISEGVITSVTNAGNAIIALQEALPTESWFDGKMDLDTFSSYIDKFATAMSEFSTTAAEMKPDAIDTAISTAYRIKNLISALSEIEDMEAANAFAGVGVGDGPLINLGQAIGTFGESVANIEVEKVNTAVSTALKLKNFASSLTDFDPEGIEKFKKVKGIGTAISDYSKKVEDIESGKVTSSISDAIRLKNLITSLVGIDPSGVSNFKIGPIGTAIKSYSASIAGIDPGAISSSISAATKLKNFISSLSGFDGSGVASFKSAVSSLGKTNLDGIVNAFSGADSTLSGIGSNLISSLSNGINSRTSSATSAATTVINSVANVFRGNFGRFNTLGAGLMGNFVMGIRSRSSSAISAATSVLSSAASAARGYYGSFYSSGSYVASGFAAGIRDNIWSAAMAAAAMASAASAAARANLKIKSPSRVFKKIGSYVPQGFAIGIKMYGNLVKSSVSTMSDKAINTTQKAMSRVNELLDSDMDNQPSIRPVLDLSDIKTGASAINGMLNGKRSIGVIANLGSISSTMGNRNQNSNDDVVYAINKLRKELGNVGGTQYNIGGITYDDGSNIAELVQSLIRAAKIERRI